MERLKAIGFDRLVEINCRQINRSLCAQYMACFDPPTKQVSIRGETRVIGAEHVHQLMGLPFGGKGREVKLSEQNPNFRDFRRAYKIVKYKTLGDTLSEKLDENFEYLFVLFTLGTLLAPSASIYVSDRMLKVVTLTKDALGEFDWSSFILEELIQQIHEFNKDSHKSKGNKRKTIGGCVYFLMVASEHESAMAYWTDDRVKSRAVLEKKSKKGLLSRASRSQASDTTSASFDLHTMLTHPEVRTTYFRLVSMLGQEMLALQDILTKSPNNQPSSSGECEEEDEKERDEEDDDKERDEEDDEKEIEDEDDEKERDDEDDSKERDEEDENIVDIDDDDDNDDHRHDTPIVQHGLHVEPTEEYVVEEEVAKPQLQEGERSDEKIRRSKRLITRSSVLKSPWIDPNHKMKGKRPYDEKEQLYQLCTTHVTKDEAEEEFVEIKGWHLQRVELLCLKPRAWINDTVMSMVAKTLVADQLENGGTVNRHIFSGITGSAMFKTRQR
ncbi:hypothetical protein K1719_023542 [Acacia pycnantha]|nr:hypothetical protein K1719_023542 [Acacia pycnantha]